MMWAKPVGGQLSWHAFLARQIWLSFFSPSRTPPPSTAAAAVLLRRCLSKLYVSPIRPNETKITAAQAGFRHSSSPHYQHTSPHLTIWRKPYLCLLLYSWSRITNRVQRSIIQSRVQNCLLVDRFFLCPKQKIHSINLVFFDFLRYLSDFRKQRVSQNPPLKFWAHLCTKNLPDMKYKYLKIFGFGDQNRAPQFS